MYLQPLTCGAYVGYLMLNLLSQSIDSSEKTVPTVEKLQGCHSGQGLHPTCSSSTPDIPVSDVLACDIGSHESSLNVICVYRPPLGVIHNSTLFSLRQLTLLRLSV